MKPNPRPAPKTPTPEERAAKLVRVYRWGQISYAVQFGSVDLGGGDTHEIETALAEKLRAFVAREIRSAIAADRKARKKRAGRKG